MCLKEFILATNDQLTRLKKQFSTKYRQHTSTSFAYCQNLMLWDARQQTPLHPTRLNGQPDDHRNLCFARVSRQNVSNANRNGWSTATACTRVNTKYCCLGISASPVGRGKAVPLQAWTGPQDSRRLRPPDLLTSAHEGGSQPWAPATFTPRINLVLIFRGWVDPRAHGTVRCHGKNPSDTGNQSRDLPTCSAVPKPLCYPRPSPVGVTKIIIINCHKHEQIHTPL